MLRGNAAIVWPGLSKYKDNDRVALASGNTELEKSELNLTRNIEHAVYSAEISTLLCLSS